MNPPPVQVERRAGQRFPFLLPVFVRDGSSNVEARGFTQDISSRGVFFFTDAAFREGAAIELTLNMPSEITLGESMRVRCQGCVLRVVLPPDFPQPSLPQPDESLQGRSTFPATAANPCAERKIGVAVRFHGYEYLPEISDSSSFPRVAALHERRAEPEPDPPGLAGRDLIAH